MRASFPFSIGPAAVTLPSIAAKNDVFPSETEYVISHHWAR